MFSRCTNLKELNISNFNTEKVNDMKCMFYNNSALKELNISNFNIKNVDNMQFIFHTCSSLKKIICSDEVKAEIKKKYNNLFFK